MSSLNQKSIQPQKRPIQKSNNNSQDTTDIKRIISIIAISVLSLGAIGGGGYFAYEKLKPQPQLNWTAYDEVLSTGQQIKHTQAISYKTIDLVDPFVEVENDPMYLSIKKVDALEAIWLSSENNDFYCTGNIDKKCSINVIFTDKKGTTSKNFNYEGGDEKTAYIFQNQVKSFIELIKESTELKVKVELKYPQMTESEKIDKSSKRSGSYSDRVTKEHTFKITGLVWI